ASGATLALGVIAFQALVLAPVSHGDEAWERKAYREALVHYERGYWDPSDAYAHYSVGWCHMALEDFAGALRAFHAAIELEPENAVYRLDRVWPLVRMGRLTEARSDLASARRLDGADAAVVQALGSALAEAFLESARQLLQASRLPEAYSALEAAREL